VKVQDARLAGGRDAGADRQALGVRGTDDVFAGV
jgi:hypothetical protein